MGDPKILWGKANRFYPIYQPYKTLYRVVTSSHQSGNAATTSPDL